MTLDAQPAFDEVTDSERRRLGRYVLRYRIAEGGMGTVYLAQLRAADVFEKWVAIKVIHRHVATEPSFVRMFMDEARITARIDHPNVAHVFDFGEERGAYYLAMEYLHGEPLNSVIKAAWERGTMAPWLAARIAADAARGLHAAHELRLPDGSPAGIVHRDVSPQNVFVLYNGAAKLVDFGIARSNDRLADRTQSDVFKGKIAYLSPEQVNRAPFDRRADVFALGIVLWEASLGRRLFRSDSEIATLMAIAEAKVPRPSEVRSDYPPALERVVLRALARDPAERYATAAELARDLERYLAGTGAPCGVDEVADAMRALFADRVATRERLLASEAEEVSPARVELHSHSSFPGARPPRAEESDDAPIHSPSATRLDGPARVAVEPPIAEAPARDRFGRTAVLSGTLLALVCGVGSWAITRGARRSGHDAERPPALEPHAAPASAPTPTEPPHAASATPVLAHPDGDARDAARDETAPRDAGALSPPDAAAARAGAPDPRRTHSARPRAHAAEALPADGLRPVTNLDGPL